MRSPDHMAKTSVVAWSLQRGEVPEELLRQHGVPTTAERISFCLRDPPWVRNSPRRLLSVSIDQCVLQQLASP
eukprot:5729439-Amphidinium_carterae.1